MKTRIRGAQARGFSGAAYSTNTNILDQFRYNASAYWHKDIARELLASFQAGGETFHLAEPGLHREYQRDHTAGRLPYFQFSKISDDYRGGPQQWPA